MSDCRWFHGTGSNRLASIASLGLLPCDEVEEQTEFRAHYPGMSRPGKVYLADDADRALGWAERLVAFTADQPVVLCVEPVVELKLDGNMGYSQAHYKEHAGAIPVTRVRRHDFEGCCEPLARAA